MAIWSAAIAAGGSIIGGAVSASGSAKAARIAARYNRENFQNRYQWQVDDMKKAGLNPMLSAISSPPTPTGAQAANVPDYSGAIPAGVNAYQAAKTQQAQRENIQTDTNKKAAEGTAVEIANTIAQASPEYKNAVDAIGPKGERGVSAAAQQRFDAQTSGIVSAAKEAAAKADTAELLAKISREDLTVAQVRAKYADQLAEISVRYNDAMAQAEKNNLSQSSADAKFWETVGAWGSSGNFSKQFLFVIAEIVRAMRQSK